MKYDRAVSKLMRLDLIDFSSREVMVSGISFRYNSLISLIVRMSCFPALRRSNVDLRSSRTMAKVWVKADALSNYSFILANIIFV